MILKKENLFYINTITHEGKVLVFATHKDRTIYYTIRRSGFEDVFANDSSTASISETGNITSELQFQEWENWIKLELPEGSTPKFSEGFDFDQSVIDKELDDNTRQDDTGNLIKDSGGNPEYIIRSRYFTSDQSEIAPVQLISAMGHVYVIRQAKALARRVKQKTLLVDRFVLDGMKNRLIRKLDVRFKRSRKKHEPLKPKSGNKKMVVDALDFRDANNKPFYEPTTELSFINDVSKGWFAVVLSPTEKAEHFKWHFFTYTAKQQAIQIFSVNCSDEGLFDLKDSREGAGITRQLINLREIAITGRPVATKYDRQFERETQSGEVQLLRESTHVMLAVPTDKGTAAFSFAAAKDGSLSYLSDEDNNHGDASSKRLRGDVRDVMLPLNTLDEIKIIGGAEPAGGKITGMQRGDEDQVLIHYEATGDLPLSNPANIEISGTQHYNGNYRTNQIVVGQLKNPIQKNARRVRLAQRLEESLPVQTRIYFQNQHTKFIAVLSQNASKGSRRLSIEPAEQSISANSKIILVDSFVIDTPFQNNQNNQTNSKNLLGEWEEIKEPVNKVFDGRITGLANHAENQLRINAFNHGLEDGDFVQVVETHSLNQTVKAKQASSGNTLELDTKWPSGEAINVNRIASRRRGLVFDGVNDHVHIQDGTDYLKNRGFTVEAWVRTVLPGVILAKSPEDQDTETVKFTRRGQLILGINDQGQVYLDADGGRYIANTGSHTSILDGNWHHIAVSSQQNQQAAYYIDGESIEDIQLKITPTPPIPPTVISADGTVISAPEVKQDPTGYSLKIGQAHNKEMDRLQLTGFEGELADIRLWDRAREAKPLKDSMYLSLNGNEADLVGYWRLGGIIEGTQRKVVDLSMLSNDGIVFGNTYVAERTLGRTLSDGLTEATSFENNELIAVRQGGTYEEIFEYKPGNDIGSTNSTVTDLETPFAVKYWGKSSRESDDIVNFEHDTVTT